MKTCRAILPWVTLGLALAPAAAAAQEWTALTPDNRAPGVRVDSIAPDARDRAAAATLGEVVRGRVAGLNVLQSSGTVGAEPRLWIRGASSVLLRNDPLVVVDGVRIHSEPGGLGVDIGGQATSRLDDLTPDQVASVRVLRGPAATAAYGPEGAAGVLEITTRGGAGHRDGEPRVHAWSSLGVRQEATEFPANYGRPGVSAGGGSIVIDYCTLQLQARGLCTPTQTAANSFNPLEENSPFRDGLATSAGVRLSGRAGGGAGYALSAGTERAEGVLSSNAQELRHVRGSVRVERGPARLALTGAHVRRDTDLPFGGLTLASRIGAGLTGTATDDVNGGYAPELIEEDEYSIGQEVRHTTLGGSLEVDVLPWLALGGRAGRDEVRADADMRFTEFPFVSTVDDERTRWHWSAHATARAGRAEGVSGVLTAGLERLGSDLDISTREESGSGGSSATETEVHQEQRAIFARGALGWRALRLGGTVRRDTPEFGDDEPGRLSWSVGGEWNVTGAFAAPGWLDGLTLRAAHGQTERGLEWFSSLEDGLFSCGPGCGPEMVETLTETEAGVDLRLFGRVDLGVTGYAREAKDVIAAAPALTPFATIRNRGVEAVAGVHGPERGAVRWGLDLTVAHNRNEFQADGGLSAGLFSSHRDGYPMGSYFTRPITGFQDANGDGIITPCDDLGTGCEVTLGMDQEYAGTPTPDLLGALAGTLRLRERVTLRVRADWQGGAEVLDFTTAERCVLRLNCATGYDPQALEDQAAIAAWGLGSRAGYIHDADFVRLREVALTLSAPEGWTRRLGAAGLELTFAGRNLAVWTDYPGLDPETSPMGPELFGLLDAFEQPPVRTFTTRIDVRF